ncbi:MAG: glycosyltransferase [Bacteroidota bacterium]
MIAVLDWGLGHASRSIALAARLEENGEVVIWASAGHARIILQEAYPDREIHQLPSYRVRYPTGNMYWNMVGQMPRMVKAIWFENRVVYRLTKSEKIDRIISDSRFGAYVKGIPSVFLSHQLRPIFGLPGVGVLYRWWLRRFTAYWVPDEDGPGRLSGQLSNGKGYYPVYYIGQLSRLVHYLSNEQKDEGKIASYDLVCLLSGPEPQRSHLEAILIKRLCDYPGESLVIQGLPSEEPKRRRKLGNLTIISYTNAEETAHYLQRAKKVLCRSGYSSLMDLVAFGKKAILVPTPGQTEQIYLANQAERQGWAIVVSQNELVSMTI